MAYVWESAIYYSKDKIFSDPISELIFILEIFHHWNTLTLIPAKTSISNGIILINADQYMSYLNEVVNKHYRLLCRCKFCVMLFTFKKIIIVHYHYHYYNRSLTTLLSSRCSSDKHSMITSMIPSMQCSTPSRITGFISVSECLLHPILHEVLVDKFVIVTASVIFRRIPRGKGKQWGTGR